MATSQAEDSTVDSDRDNVSQRAESGSEDESAPRGKVRDKRNRNNRRKNKGKARDTDGAGTEDESSSSDSSSEDEDEPHGEGRASDAASDGGRGSEKSEGSDLEELDAELHARANRGAVARENRKAVDAFEDEILGPRPRRTTASDGEEYRPEGKPAAKKGKTRAPVKKAKANVKEEDLDPSSVSLPMKAQDRLDLAFLGYVRINVVHIDPDVKANWNVVNNRDLDPHHEKMIVHSLRERKEDYEHPMHLTVDGSKIDPACLSRSPYPVKDLKPLVFTCPVNERVIDFLSGNHRRGATTKYSAELREELSKMEEQLRVHRAQQAAGGQQQIGADGAVVDRLADLLEAKIILLKLALDDSQLWLQKVYDSRILDDDIVGKALLATNQVRPAKAADAQEKVQMLSWRINQTITRWRKQNPGTQLPTAGSSKYRKEIMGEAFSEAELKDGTGSFLFTVEENLALIQDIWQFSYFQVTGRVPLVRLEDALGKAGKKDMAKKSGSAMAWRWLVHTLMRDLRMIATCVEFPDYEDLEDESSHHMRNYVKVLEGSNEPLQITEAMWNDAGYGVPSGRDKPSAVKSVNEVGRANAHNLYRQEESQWVSHENTCVAVWDSTLLAIVDSIYDKEFRVTGANEKFGEWDSKEWKSAMRRYRETLMQVLPEEWKLRLKNVGTGEMAARDQVALRDAKRKLVWFQALQALGGRELDVPFLCDKFMEDFSRSLAGAESGFKLITRTLDPLAQVGMLRAVGEGDKDNKVYPDYLSYVVQILADEQRFNLKSIESAQGPLCAWLFENLALITRCGNAYQHSHLKPAHESFFSISIHSLSLEFAKLHPKSKDKEKNFLPAANFPKAFNTTLDKVNVNVDDRSDIIKICKILQETAARKPLPTDKLKAVDRAAKNLAGQDVLGRALTCLSLRDVKEFPCLAILYRHLLDWTQPEGGAKKGKSNGFLAYAYLLYVGYRVYGDTIGRMFELVPYMELRESLFKFLGQHCQNTLDNFLSGDSNVRPAVTLYANWDHKFAGQFVDLHGNPLVFASPADGTTGPPRPMYETPTVTPYNSTNMAKHTALVKKIVDGIVKCPLATVYDRKKRCTPEIAKLARSVACAYIRNALELEFLSENLDPERVYVHPTDEDLEPFLPPLPVAGATREESYASLKVFKKKNPSQYRLYCHGLVVEGYEQDPTAEHDADADDEDENAAAPTPSSSTSVKRKSTHASGNVYPQEINWDDLWAQVEPNKLNPARLPDPVRTADGKQSALAPGGPLDTTIPSPLSHRDRRKLKARAQKSPSSRDRHADKTPALSSSNAQPPSTPPSPVSSRAPRPGTPPPPAKKPKPPPGFTVTPRSVSRAQTSAQPSAPAPPINTAMDVDSGAPPSNPSAPVQPINLSTLPPPAEDAPQASDGPMDTDPVDRPSPAPAHKAPVAVPRGPPPSIPMTPQSPGNVLVPSSSQDLPEDLVAMDTAPDHLPRTPSSSLPDVVPATYPMEPTQLPPLPPVRLVPTETQVLAEPSEEEKADFNKRLHVINSQLLEGLSKSIYDEVEADPELKFFEGEAHSRLVRRVSTYWALFRDRNHGIVPTDVFPYMREDHADVCAKVDWRASVEAFDDLGFADSFLNTAIERFSNRHVPHQRPIYDKGTAPPLQPQGTKRRERSASLIADARAAGDGSPPKSKVRRQQSPPREGEDIEYQQMDALDVSPHSRADVGDDTPAQPRRASSRARSRSRSAAPVDASLARSSPRRTRSRSASASKNTSAQGSSKPADTNIALDTVPEEQDQMSEDAQRAKTGGKGRIPVPGTQYRKKKSR